MVKFSIYKCKNGFLLNVTRGQKTDSLIYKPEERMTMLARIDDILGEEPEGSVGMDDKNKSK